MQLPFASSIVSAVLLLVGLADPESTQAVTADATTTTTTTATPIATLPPSLTLPSSAPTETISPTLTLAPATPTCVCSATTAGTATYNGNQIGSALAAASTTVSGYPHRYSNREGIAFPRCPRQYLTEFPILPRATSRFPGPDRVIYNSRGDFCGCITHRGATGNAFRSCAFN